MDDVRCTGSEGRLMDCPFRLNHNCGHNGDAGVQCTISIYYYGKLLSLLCGIVSFVILLLTNSEPSMQDVHLVP